MAMVYPCPSSVNAHHRLARAHAPPVCAQRSARAQRPAPLLPGSRAEAAQRLPHLPARRMHCRLPSAVALADIADLAEIGGAVGVLLGAAGAGVAYTVQQSKAALEQQVAALQADVAAKEAALAAAEAERKVLEARVAALTPLEARNADNAKENLKLVRALEIKDGQLASFMAVARRQIKFLEDRVKELQR